MVSKSQLLRGESKMLEKLHSSVVAVARLSCTSVSVSLRLDILVADLLVHTQAKRLNFPQENQIEQLNRILCIIHIEFVKINTHT